MTTKDKIINIIEEGIEKCMYAKHGLFSGIGMSNLVDRILEVKPKPDLKKEFIICSAVKWLKIGIPGGIIVCGRRHADCYKSIEGILEINLGDLDEDERKRQGFMTSMGRYVTRKEAFKIAMANNQIFHSMYDNDDSREERELTSEDLFGMND